MPWLQTARIPFNLGCETLQHLVMIEDTESGIVEKSQANEVRGKGPHSEVHCNTLLGMTCRGRVAGLVN